MAARTKQTRQEAAGDPLSDLLDDTDMKRAAARARPRAHQKSYRGNAEVWWIAAAASLIWIASVLAFSWSRYALPSEPGSVLDAARDRIGFADWLMIGAAIAGPILLIWVIAWLIQRAMELRDQSRRLAKAAILLTEAAETTEMRAELLLPSKGSGGLLGGSGLNREIERATHAMAALKAQMGAMEQAMARQAATLDDRSERSKALSSRSSAVALPDGTARASGNLVVQDDYSPPAPVSPQSLDAGAKAPKTALAADTGGKAPDAVDLSLSAAPESRVDTLRAGLLAAGKAAAWPKLVDETKKSDPEPASEPHTPTAAFVDERLDPFDDLGAAPALGSADPLKVESGAETDLDWAEASAWPEDPDKVADASGPKTEKADPVDFQLPALDWRKFIRAANFPESEDDTETLDALYDTLTDPQAAELLQSAEDTLATLADLDLYMEDFVPKMSPITSWRAYLEGKDESGLEGIDSPIEQSRIDVKLQNDSGFRKLVERFAERYEKVVTRLFEEAGDDRLVLDLADSRTGRAFLLLGKPLGKL